MAQPGVVDSIIAKGRYIEVGMNDIQFYAFDSYYNSVITRQLGSYHVVVIMSQQGAILAHFSPRPSLEDNALHAGEKHVDSFMNRVIAFYNTHRAALGNRTDSWIVCAWLMGELALPDQQKIIRGKLQKAGLLNIKQARYDVGVPEVRRDKGTVSINGTGSNPVLSLEGRPIQAVPMPGSSTTHQTTAGPSSTPHSQGTNNPEDIYYGQSVRYNQQRRRFECLENGKWVYYPYKLVNNKWVPN